MTPMFSLHITYTPPRLGDLGGVEAHTLHLANEMVKQKAEVEIICADEKMGSREELDKRITTKLLPTIFKIQNSNITPKLPFELFKSKSEIVHTMVPTPWSSDLSAIIAKLRRKKLVVTIHSDLFSPSKIGGLITKFYVNTFYHLVLSLADKIIIVNPDYKKSFIHTRGVLGRYDKKIIFVPNGVDIKKFDSKSAVKKKNNVLFVSVLDEYHEFKGLSYLIDAVPSVIKKVPNATFTIVGGGPLKEKYESMVANMKISDKINFIGAQPNTLLPKLYSEHAVFVLPSVDTEAFGIVLIEAMSTKTPVITTECAGMWKEIKENNTGVVVPIRNSNSIAEALISILNNKREAKKMGENGRALVEEKYSWEKVGKITARIYAEVLKK